MHRFFTPCVSGVVLASFDRAGTVQEDSTSAATSLEHAIGADGQEVREPVLCWRVWWTTSPNSCPHRSVAMMVGMTLPVASDCNNQ